MYRHFVGIFRAAIAFLANLEFLRRVGLSIGEDRQTDDSRAKGEGEDFLHISEDEFVLYMPEPYSSYITL